MLEKIVGPIHGQDYLQVVEPTLTPWVVWLIHRP